MKNITLVVPSTSQSEMNNLVETVCDIMGQDHKALKDKFKMIDIPNPKKIMDLCEYLKLNVEFRNQGEAPEIAIKMRVPKNFKLEEPKKEVVREKVEAEVFNIPEGTKAEIGPVGPDGGSSGGSGMIGDPVDEATMEGLTGPKSILGHINTTPTTEEVKAPTEEKGAPIADTELNKADDDEDIPF